MDPTSPMPGHVDLVSRTSTFVSIDVVDSTVLKTGETEQDIIYTFLTYHKMIRDLAYAHHGEIITISGDGVMCRFGRADDAIEAVAHILQERVPFNKRQNRLSRAFLLRIGVNTGDVYESQALAPGQLISHTIDVAAKLQQACPPNHARFSQETVSLLKPAHASLQRLGWDAALKTTAYQYSPSSELSGAPRALPDPVRTLLVEDDLIELMKLKKILFARRHDALPVYTGPQAIHCMTAWTPHLVLLSADLPWEAGWELLKGLRSDPKASSIPIIMMSRQGSGENVEKCFTLGGNGFLSKPLEELHIIKRMDGALREFYL